MIREEKDLLLKDLCARLPYGVKIELTWWVMGEGMYINTTLEPDHIEQLLNDEDGDTEIKPYLRPLSSMTKEESAEVSNIISEWYDEELFVLTEEPFLEYALSKINYSINPRLFDWLNKKMFDYRGLIPKGLAEIAPEGMYNN